MIRVLICDDQAIARHGLQMILSSAPDLEVVGQAEDGQGTSPWTGCTSRTHQGQTRIRRDD